MPHEHLVTARLLAAAADVQPLGFNWAFNKWLVILAALAAGAMVYYLYRAQRAIASRWAVNVLTTIRVLLMLLMLVLLAGPVYQWQHTRGSGGTLWLVIDRSGSMAHADRQMTPVERLRWAEALGLIDAGLRPGKLDRHVASLAALRSDLAHLERRSEIVTAEPDERRRAIATARGVQTWTERLQSLVGQLESDPSLKGTHATAVATLREAADPLTAVAGKAAGGEGLDATTDGGIPWAGALKQLDAAITALRPLADAADETFLAERHNDAAVREALARVSEKTRFELAVAALTESRRAGKAAPSALLEAAGGQTVKVVGFADAPQAVPSADAAALPDVIRTALKPGGHATDLAGALAWVSEQIGPDERASVVVVSDGRQTGGGDLVESSRLLAGRGVRVFTVAIGSEQVAPDAAVEQVDAPDWIFKDDTLRASALLRLDGLAGKPVTVEFRRGGEPPQRQTVTPQAGRATQLVSFNERPAEPGVYEYEVTIKELPDEVVKENNRQRLRVTVKKDKLNALVIEDQPRWEYRYLTNYLERDQRVKLQKVLFQAASIAGVERPQPVMASPDNAVSEAQLLPDTPEKWAAFDFIVLGDVPPERLTDRQQELLATAVRDRGATLLMIAGPFNMPLRYSRPDGDHSAAVAPARNVHDLLPIDLTTPWTSQEVSAHLKNGFRASVAPEGAGSILSQFTVDGGLNDRLWASLPAWYWHSGQTQTKLAASVIWAVAEPGGSPGLTLEQARKRALLATMPVGLGRVMYLASDSTWRLRQVEGENLHERFWGQVVRWVVGNDLPAGGRLVKFGTDKPRYVAGEPVAVTARLLGANLAPLTGRQVKVVATAQGEDGTAGGAGKRLNETTLVEMPDAPGFYRATINRLPAGRVELTLAGKEVEESLASDPAVVAKALAIDVLPHRDDETRNVNADFAALARVAEASGGAAVRGPHADVLAKHLPQLTDAAEVVEQVGLFSNPDDRATRMTHWAFLALFVSLLTAEWVIRKAAGLI